MKAQFTEPNTGRRFIGEAEAAIFNLIVVHGGEKTNTDRDQ